MTTPKRNGNGKFTRTLEAANREKAVLELFDRGYTPEHIREKLGLKYVNSVYKIRQRALDRVVEPQAREMRTRLLSQAESDLDIHQRIVENPPPKTTATGRIVFQPGTEERDDQGKIIPNTGTPVPDLMVTEHSLEAKRKIRDQIAKLVPGTVEETRNTRITVEHQAEAQSQLARLKMVIDTNPQLARVIGWLNQGGDPADWGLTERDIENIIPGQIER